MRWGTTREVLVLRSSLFHLRAAQVSRGRSRARSYHAESTRSLLHTEVKRHRARLVVRWGTTREVLVLRSSFVALQVIFSYPLFIRGRSRARSYCRIVPFCTRKLNGIEQLGPRAKSSCCAPLLFSCFIKLIWYPLFIQGRSRARSYHAESTRSLLHTEVKRHRARLVVRWGTTREVLVLRSSFFFLFTLFQLRRSLIWYPLFIRGRSRARSYHAESTRSLLHTEVKRHRARLVVRWGTTREVLVLRSSFFFSYNFVPTAQVIDLVSLVHPRAQSSAIISCRIHPFPSAHGS